MSGWVVQLHIPKTGGSALRHAMQGFEAWKRFGHSQALHDVPPGDVVAVTVRDPVRRFLSACAWTRPTLREMGYRDADALARDIGRVPADQVFRPQSWWLESAERVWERAIWVGWTETLDADFERLRWTLDLDDTYRLPPVGHVKRNAASALDALSPLGEANVRDCYAADYELLGML